VEVWGSSPHEPTTFFSTSNADFENASKLGAEHEICPINAINFSVAVLPVTLQRLIFFRTGSAKCLRKAK
jgi:hypothetical protein